MDGKYFLRIMMVGYRNHDTEPFIMNTVDGTRDFGELVLHEDAVLMNEVQVVARKPLFEQKIDRMVINVSSSVTSGGTNVLKVLERSPGVMVNRQNNTISLSGKSGVVVMINGRINYMPAEAVTQFLEGLGSDNVERIEILTTPPADLDAEGNAGYINVVLKKSTQDGFNGSYALMAGYGMGGTGTANINFNYRNRKYNLFGDYAYFHESQEQVFDFYRSIFLNGKQVETQTRSERDPNRNNHTARLGLDYQVNQQLVVGGLLTGYNTIWTMDALNIAMISGNGQLDTVINIDNYELNQWKNFGGNVNLQQTFSEDKVLTIDADYLSYTDNNPTEYHNVYSDGGGNYVYDTYTRARKETPITIRVGKVDYRSPVGKNFKMTTGLKATLSSFTNDVGVDYKSGQEWVNDPELTAKYNLVERIGAAYFSFEGSIGKKTSVKGGLRYEYTDSNLGSEEVQNIVDRQFGEFFPSVYFSRSLNEFNSFNLSYGKRITRPTFNDMAPFVIFLDPYTFFSGNPAVQPAISNNFELAYIYKSALLSFKYGIEDSTIANFQSTIIEGTNKQLIYTENLRQTEVYSLALSFPLTPVKWWNMYYNMSGVYQKAQKSEEGYVNTYEAAGFNFYSSQTFTLPKAFAFEITGYYASGGLFGIFQVKPFGAVNVALQKKFGDLGGTLRLGYDDVFNTQAYRDKLDLKEQQEYYKAYLRFTQPTLKLSYTRSFGNQNVKGSRTRDTGAEEEKRRVNN